MTERLTIPELPANTILMVEVGSTAHGTGIDGVEDHDQMAVVVETPAQVLGLDEKGFKTVMQRTQPEGMPSGFGDIDRTLHSLRRFLAMAASGNPSILMALWCPVEFSTDLGMEMRSLGDAFVGRHVIPRYRGYMQSQRQRLEKGEGRPALVAEFGYDTKYAMHAARLGLQCLELLDSGQLTFPIAGESRNWLREVRFGNVPYADWQSRCAELDRQLEERMSEESVRPEPDVSRIEAWSITAHQTMWASQAEAKKTKTKHQGGASQ